MPRPGLSGTTRSPCGVHFEPLAEHEVPPRRDPRRGIEGILEIRAAPDAGREMKVHQQPDPVRPRVRGEPPRLRQDELGEGPGARDPHRQHRVGLVDVERVSLEQRQQLGKAPRHLAAGDTYGAVGAEPGKPLQVGSLQRLLEPEQVELGQLGRDVPRGAWVESRACVAGHAPTLVEIDHQRHSGQRLAHGRDRRQAGVEVLRVDPQLHRPQSHGREFVRDLDPARRLDQRARRTVGRQPVGHAAEEAGHGHAVDLAGDVPERRFEWPRPGAVERDGLESPHVAADGERVLTDEQLGVRLETVHRVARPDAAQALVGVHEHERRRIAPAGDGIPSSGEGRIER